MQAPPLKSLNRAVALLTLLRPVRGRTDWSVAELQEACQLPVSTLHRFLSQWVKADFVVHNPATHRYQLGPGLTELGLAMWRNLEIRRAARPVMQRLARQVKLSVYLTVRDGQDGVFVERAKGWFMLRTSSPIGHRAPLYAGASRKTLLAFLPPAEAESLLQSFRYDVVGPNSPRSADQVRAQLREIRECGYALTYEETVENTAGLAVPVWDRSGEVLAALMVSGHASAFTDEEVASMVIAIRSAAADISARLS